MKKITKILQSVDWPTDVLILDFETFFDVDYCMGKGKNALSIIEYIADPRFKFTGLGFQIHSATAIQYGWWEEPKFIPGSHISWIIEQLKEKFGKALHNCTVVAKNNKFDCLILAEKFNIYPPYTIDIEDLSRYYDSRMSQKLSDLSRLFKLPAKGDTKQFKGLYWESMTPEQRQTMKEYCLRDVKNERSLLEILLPKLDNPACELDLARHTLNLFLKPTLSLDVKQAIRIAVDMDSALSEDLRKVAWVLKYRTKAKPNIPKIMRAKKIFPKILQETLPEDEVVSMKQGKNQMIPATAQDDVAFQYLLAHKDEKVRNLCRAKAACSSWPLHQSKVRRMVAQAQCSTGLIRTPLKYYGAHTGRWSGTGGWNPMNLGGKGRGRPIHPLIAQVRNTLVAPDGYTLAIVDSAQIEARELAWAAHQDGLMKGFADGKDIYSEFATELFQEHVWKPSEEEKKTSEGQEADIRRGFGKDAILGCIAFGAPILTHNGWKPIEKIDILDKIWDGDRWVNHRGIICKGKKKCVKVYNIWMTPEHEILTSDGWTTAAELSINDPLSTIDTGNLPLHPFHTGHAGALSPSNVIAFVVGRLLHQETVWSEKNLHAVISVLKRHPAKLRVIAQMYQSHTEVGFLIEFVRLLADVKQNHINIMANEVLESGPIGSQIELLFLSTWQNFQDGITPGSTSIESIMTKDTNLVILDSLLDLKILETADILYSGDYKRFQVGSMIVANCGYGMGTNTFFGRCRQNDTLRPLFDEGKYDWDFIDRLIKTYRTKYSNIPAFWREIEKCFRWPTKYPRERTEYVISNAAKLRFWRTGSTTKMQLPSGRIMNYRHAVVSAKDDKIKYLHGHLWGGSITENLIQAMCRDLLGYWLLECEKEANIKIVLHSYDELIGCVPKEYAEGDLKTMIDIMSQGPPWAEGLPLAAEGILSERYTK